MLDIDFVQNDKHNLRQSIVYQYQEGSLKGEILSKIRRVMEEKGVLFRELNYDSPRTSFIDKSLFSENCVVIDVEKIKNIISFFDFAVNLLESKSVGNKYLWLVKGKENNSEYKSLVKLSTFIEEVEITKGNFGKVFEYLKNQNKEILDTSNIKNIKIFEDSLREMTLGEKLSLNELKNKFELCLIVCISQGGTQFESSIFKTIIYRENKKKAYVLHNLLGNFMRGFENRHKDLLYQYIDQNIVIEGKESRNIINLIYKCLKDLLEINIVFNTNGGLGDDNVFFQKKMEVLKTIPIQNILRFQLNYSGWEPRFNTGNFLVEFNQFLREFVK